MNDLKKVLSIYEVNPETMAIIPQYSSNQSTFSLVKEVNDEFIVMKSPTEIIKYSCTYFGSSYRGRVEGTYSLTGISHKAPIAISPSNKLFFFPTHSPKREECSWFSHSHISKINRNSHNQTTITFTNQTTYSINVSLGSFENQVYRTAQLRSACNDRVIHTSKQHPFELVREDEIHSYINNHIG